MRRTGASSPVRHRLMTQAGVNLPDLVRSVVDTHRHLRAPLLIVLRAFKIGSATSTTT